MGSLVRHNLEMMSRKHLWIRQLSSAAILEPENRMELPKRINTMAKKANSTQMGRGGKGGSRKRDDAFTEALQMGWGQLLLFFSFLCPFATLKHKTTPNTDEMWQ